MKDTILITPNDNQYQRSRSTASGEDLHLNPTYNCNNNCLFCVSGGPQKRRKQDDLDLSQIREKIKSFNPSDIKCIVLDGGEASTYPDFVQLLDYLHQLSPEYISLLSNGVNFSDFKFAKKVISQIDSVDISVYAHKKEIYNSLTRSNNFADMVQGIKNIFKLRDKFGFSLDIDLKILICKPVCKEVHKIVDFIFDELGSPARVQFVGQSIMAKAKLNSEKVACRLTKAAPYIKKGIRRTKREDTEVLLKAIPPCILKDEKYFEYYMPFKGYTNSDYGMFQLLNGDKCQYCNYEDQCTGLRRGYVEYFDFSELEPFY